MTSSHNPYAFWMDERSVLVTKSTVVNFSHSLLVIEAKILMLIKRLYWFSLSSQLLEFKSLSCFELIVESLLNTCLLGTCFQRHA